MGEKSTPVDKQRERSGGAERHVFGFVGLAFGVIVASAAYRVWRSPMSQFPQDYGQLGDFVGGMLNPVVALAALFMLANSVVIQRRELAAAQKVLAKQAKSAEDTAKLAALNSLVEAAIGETQMHRDHLHFLLQQIANQDDAVRLYRSHDPTRPLHSPDNVYSLHDIHGIVTTRDQMNRAITLTNEAATNAMAERMKLAHQIRQMLESMGTSSKV